MGILVLMSQVVRWTRATCEFRELTVFCVNESAHPGGGSE